MSRYIDIDDVANAIYHHFPSVRTMADARGVIEEAPTIDIVRCKDCKYRDKHHYCGIWGQPYLCNDECFCSYGERSGE